MVRAGERGIGVGGALVAGQIALSLVLVVAAGLFIRTFTTLATLNVGFDRDPVLLGAARRAGTTRSRRGERPCMNGSWRPYARRPGSRTPRCPK